MFKPLLRLLQAIVLSLGLASLAWGQGSVVPPNGTYSQEVVDLSVQTAAGEVSWKRVFNGTGWRFNRHWDGINASFKPVLTQSTGGGVGLSASASGGAAALCWIWVDEDWQPGDISFIQPANPGPTAVAPSAYVPPNNAYNQTPAPLDTALSSFFSTCAQSGGNITGGNGSDLSEVFEGFRRQSNLYVGSGGTYVFKNRFLLKKQAVQTLGTSSGEPGAGTIADVRIEQKTTQVFNLEVAQLHTFFVGVDGVVVHNARSGTSGHNSAAAAGTANHRNPALGPPGAEMNVQLPGSKKRADFVDFATRTIWEMKPCHSKAMRKGIPQVDGYVDLANKATSGPFAGGGWRGIVFGGY